MGIQHTINLVFCFGVSPKKHIWQQIIYLIRPRLNVFLLLLLINRRDLIGYEMERLAGVWVVYCCCITTQFDTLLYGEENNANCSIVVLMFPVFLLI